jgi:hypothetical protein
MSKMPKESKNHVHPAATDILLARKPPHAASAKPNTIVTSSEFAFGMGPLPDGCARERQGAVCCRHLISAESSQFCASSLYTDMTYSEATPGRSTEGAAKWTSDNAMSWFVPPLVVPALLAALLLAWITYQAYS